jgi:hypothetical protein
MGGFSSIIGNEGTPSAVGSSPGALKAKNIVLVRRYNATVCDGSHSTVER